MAPSLRRSTAILLHSGVRAALDVREARLRRERDSANRWRQIRGYPPLPDLSALPFADRLKPLVLVSINTGARRGELFKKRWQDVNLDQEVLTIRAANAKSGKIRHIYLNAELAAVLKGWKEISPDTSGLVFPSEDGAMLTNVKRSWAGALTAAKIEAFRWHDLRHHFASKLAMAGVDLNTIRELSGHSSYAMTLRYAHLRRTTSARRSMSCAQIEVSQSRYRCPGQRHEVFTQLAQTRID